MSIAAKKRQQALLWLIIVLVAAGLACAQAGEVLTPAEATERAVEGASGPDREGSTAGEFQVGDEAALTGRSFLVNIMDAPAGRISAGQERGAIVTVRQVTEVEEVLWYQIEAPGGTGWVRWDNLVPVEGDDEAAEEETGVEEEAAGEDEGSGLAPGDTVYLVGRGFLVNLYNEPDGRIIATQERGAPVIILDSTTVDGTAWYQIEAATGEGWVAEENVSAEAPTN